MSIPADQKRAISDYRCASRKLAKLMRAHGREADAEEIEAMMNAITVTFDRIALGEGERTLREVKEA